MLHAWACPGCTALHRAAVWGHLACVRSLVQAGADVTKRTRYNERARDAAARYGHQECVKYLDRIGRQTCTLTRAINDFLLCPFIEARNALKADIEGIRSVIADADRIAGKWGKDDKV